MKKLKKRNQIRNKFKIKTMKSNQCDEWGFPSDYKPSMLGMVDGVILD